MYIDEDGKLHDEEPDPILFLTRQCLKCYKRELDCACEVTESLPGFTLQEAEKLFILKTDFLMGYVES
jgi:hypothetical protein